MAALVASVVNVRPSTIDASFSGTAHISGGIGHELVIGGVGYVGCHCFIDPSEAVVGSGRGGVGWYLERDIGVGFGGANFVLQGQVSVIVGNELNLGGDLCDKE